MSLEEKERKIKIDYQKRKYLIDKEIRSYYASKTALSNPSKVTDMQLQDLKKIAKRAKISEIDMFFKATFATINRLNQDEQFSQSTKARDKQKRKFSQIMSAARKLSENMTHENAPDLTLISEKLIKINEDEDKPVFYAATFLEALNKVVYAYECWELASDLAKGQAQKSDTFQIDLLAEVFHSFGGKISSSEKAIFPEYVQLCEKIARCEVHKDPSNHIDKIKHKYKKV